MFLTRKMLCSKVAIETYESFFFFEIQNFKAV